MNCNECGQSLPGKPATYRSAPEFIVPKTAPKVFIQFLSEKMKHRLTRFFVGLGAVIVGLAVLAIVPYGMGQLNSWIAHMFNYEFMKGSSAPDFVNKFQLGVITIGVALIGFCIVRGVIRGIYGLGKDLMGEH